MEFFLPNPCRGAWNQTHITRDQNETACLLTCNCGSKRGRRRGHDEQIRVMDVDDVVTTQTNDDEDTGATII